MQEGPFTQRAVGPPGDLQGQGRATGGAIRPDAAVRGQLVAALAVQPQRQRRQATPGSSRADACRRVRQIIRAPRRRAMAQPPS